MADAPKTTERLDDESKADAPRHDTAEVPVTMGVMRRAFRINEVFTFLVAVGAAIAAVLGVYRLVLSEAAAAGRDATSSFEKRVTALELEQPEIRKDVRSLYRAVLTGQRQDRLEQPLPPKVTP